MNQGSLRLRLLFLGTVSVWLALGLAVLGLTELFERHVERRAMAELDTHLGQIIAGLEGGSDDPLILARAPADPRFAKPLSGLYWQVTPAEGRVLRSRSLWDQILELPTDTLTRGEVHRYDLPGPNDAELLVLERQVQLPERLGGHTVRAAVAKDRRAIRSAVQAFRGDLIPYLLLLAGLLTAANVAQVLLGLRPLKAVHSRLAAIRSGTADRLGSDFPKEILPLAREVDELLKASEAQIEQARRRAGDLAHGLKTPLQALVGDVARLRQQDQHRVAADIDGVVATMQHHIDRELTRARLNAGTHQATAAVRPLVDRVAAVVARTPEAEGIALDIHVDDSLVVAIDGEDLIEALGNLMENAFRHADGRVVIAGEARDPQTVCLEVRDDGPGMEPGHLTQALDRGTRFAEGAETTGLGLAIVEEIATAWQGKLTLRNGQPGLVARLCLPRAAR